MTHNKQISDYHVHSQWSPDSSMETLSILEVCREKRILDIAFTDHVDLFFPHKSNPTFDISAYQKEIAKLKRYYSDIHLLAGIEVGVNKSNLVETENLLEKYSFDFVIASIHTFENAAFCDRSLLKKISKEALIQNYFDEMIFVTKKLKAYQVLGHIDYLLRYHNYSREEFLSHSSQIEEVLDNLILGNHGLEINTKGWNRENWQNPLLPILMQYKKMGGKYITIGSDSHSLNQLGNNFEQAIDLLREASFTEYYLYRNLEWTPVSLSG